jgi:hypothetical protein
MRTSRRITWARLRVYFGAFLLVMFVLGGLIIYASFLADNTSGVAQPNLRAMGVAIIALTGIAAIFAAVVRKRLLDYE